MEKAAHTAVRLWSVFWHEIGLRSPISSKNPNSKILKKTKTLIRPYFKTLKSPIIKHPRIGCFDTMTKHIEQKYKGRNSLYCVINDHTNPPIYTIRTNLI